MADDQTLSGRCPTHDLLNQTWSKQEAIWILSNAEILGVCESCFLFFVRIVEHDQVGRDLDEISGALQGRATKGDPA